MGLGAVWGKCGGYDAAITGLQGIDRPQASPTAPLSPSPPLGPRGLTCSQWTWATDDVLARITRRVWRACWGSGVSFGGADAAKAPDAHTMRGRDGGRGRAIVIARDGGDCGCATRRNKSPSARLFAVHAAGEGISDTLPAGARGTFSKAVHVPLRARPRPILIIAALHRSVVAIPPTRGADGGVDVNTKVGDLDRGAPTARTVATNRDPRGGAGITSRTTRHDDVRTDASTIVRGPSVGACARAPGSASSAAACSDALLITAADAGSA